MKKSTKIILYLVLAVVGIGLTYASYQLLDPVAVRSEVILKQTIQERFDTDATYKDYDIIVKKVSLVRLSRRQYKILVEIEYLEGKTRTIAADMILSSEVYYYEFPMEALTPITSDYINTTMTEEWEKEMRELERMFME